MLEKVAEGGWLDPAHPVETSIANFNAARRGPRSARRTTWSAIGVITAVETHATTKTETANA